MKLVHIEWVDSDGGGGWRPLEDAAREAAADPLTCESVGWLVDDADRYVLVAASITTGRKTSLVSDPMQIPRIAVVAIRELKTGRTLYRAP